MPLPGRQGRNATQPATQPHRPPVNPRGGSKRTSRSTRTKRRPRFGRILTGLLLAMALLLVGAWVYVDLSLDRVEATQDYDGRPAETAGTTWLVVGSDSREGLDEDDQQRLNTGPGGADATDTIMLAHLPANDTDPTLVSIPRDLAVNIPGHGTSRVNSAYTLGQQQLLTRTVEEATGLRIDHYAEIGFAGFEDIVDAIGGVEMDIESDMHDTNTGETIEAGQRKLSGEQALHFVRMRYSEATPRSDLDRVGNQREFIGALADDIASPTTLLNPFRVVPLLSAGPDALTVGEGDRLHHLAGLAWAMRGVSSGDVVTTTVPVVSANASQMDLARAEGLFEALRTDSPVPENLIFE